MTLQDFTIYVNSKFNSLFGVGDILPNFGDELDLTAKYLLITGITSLAKPKIENLLDVITDEKGKRAMLDQLAWGIPAGSVFKNLDINDDGKITTGDDLNADDVINDEDLEMYAQYFTFEALEAGTFTLTIGKAVPTSVLQNISYSIDDGETWTTTDNIDNQTVTITTPQIAVNDRVLWKGNGIGMSVEINNNDRLSTSSNFSATGQFNVEGNIMSLLYNDDFKDVVELDKSSSYNFSCLFYAYNTPTPSKLVSAKKLIMPRKSVTPYCCMRMFQSCSLLTTAPKILPALKLSEHCYHAMFIACQELVNTPELPATILGDSYSCYEGMFYECTSLTTAPELPAIILSNSCYYQMFCNCTALTTAPELPAKILDHYCYSYMFQGCNHLTTASELPATELKSTCYYGMFTNCTALTTAPELPATKLEAGCYSAMFYNCRGLINAPELPATELKQACYDTMFRNCVNLTTAPELPATTLALECYESMFQGCSKLTYIKCLAKDNMTANKCLNNWVSGVSATGTFVKDSSVEWPSGASGIPSGWTVENV